MNALIKRKKHTNVEVMRIYICWALILKVFRLLVYEVPICQFDSAQRRDAHIPSEQVYVFCLASSVIILFYLILLLGVTSSFKSIFFATKIT